MEFKREDKKIKIKILIKDCYTIGEICPSIDKSMLEFFYNDSPDYVIYNNSTYDNFLNYQCVRIYFDVEAYHPDFNVCDYALCNDIMTFGDRYCRYPQILSYSKEIKMLQMKERNNINKKTRFCNFVYSNANAHEMREKLFKEIYKYKKIDSGGKYLNNIGYNIAGGIGDYREKLKFQSECKFSIVVENVSLPGHTSEKILHAFLSNTIPIYFGDPLIEEVFNKKALINVHNFNCIQDVIERVKVIDNDNELFNQMLNEPVFNKKFNIEQKEKEVFEFYMNIFSQDLDKAIRRNNMIQSKSHEIRLKYGWIIYKQRWKIEKYINGILRKIGLTRFKNYYIKKFYK